MSSYISYIGPYIKFPSISEKDDEDFMDKIMDNNESKNYAEVGYISKNYRYLISSNKFAFFTDEVENIMEKEITVEERNDVITKFMKHTEKFIKNFKKSFDIDLEIKYGAIFYEA